MALNGSLAKRTNVLACFGDQSGTHCCECHRLLVHCLFQLHNYLKDLNDTNLPPLGSSLGACQADELRCAVNSMNGYDDQHYYSDQCFTEEVHHPRYRRSQCPIREEITDQLEKDMIVRPPT
jgi:hypothetical protein